MTRAVFFWAIFLEGHQTEQKRFFFRAPSVLTALAERRAKERVTYFYESKHGQNC
jgi:hypothetical protein